jgi:hypothetical protein
VIPTKQTIIHDPDNGKIGNCFSAVIASLLHIPIEEVPDFNAEGTWTADLNAWLRPRGLCYLSLEVKAWGDGGVAEWLKNYGVVGLHHEIAGPSPRFNDNLHACVGADGLLIFDPHPSDAGVVQHHHIGLFVLLQPWTYVLPHAVAHTADGLAEWLLEEADTEQLCNRPNKAAKLRGWAAALAGQAPKVPALRMLTDEEVDNAQEGAYRALVAKGFNGGMGGEQWDRASAAAIQRKCAEVWGQTLSAEPANKEQT